MPGFFVNKDNKINPATYMDWATNHSIPCAAINTEEVLRIRIIAGILNRMYGDKKQLITKDFRRMITKILKKNGKTANMIKIDTDTGMMMFIRESS